MGLYIISKVEKESIKKLWITINIIYNIEEFHKLKP